VLKKVRFFQSLAESFRWYRLWGTLPVKSWILAAENFKAENFKKAEGLYRFGLETNKDHPAAHSARLDLSYCLYRLDEFDKAKEELSYLISNNTRLKDAYILRSKIELILGEISSAVLTMEECLRVFPSDPRVISQFTHFSLMTAIDSLHADELKDRLVAIKMRLSLEDQDNIYLDTALAHYELRWGDLRRADRILARVLATGSAPFEAVLMRGERLLAQGRVLPARELLSRAMQMSKKDPRPVVVLSASYLRSGIEGNFDYAIQLAEASCKASQWKNAECISALAKALDFKGEKAKAHLFVERTKQLESFNEPAVAYPHSYSQIGGRAQKVFNS
jgi:tetratricopeptide (TPR) repeat protein